MREFVWHFIGRVFIGNGLGIAVIVACSANKVYVTCGMLCVSTEQKTEKQQKKKHINVGCKMGANEELLEIIFYYNVMRYSFSGLPWQINS